MALYAEGRYVNKCIATRYEHTARGINFAFLFFLFFSAAIISQAQTVRPLTAKETSSIRSFLLSYLRDDSAEGALTLVTRHARST